MPRQHAPIPAAELAAVVDVFGLVGAKGLAVQS